MEQQRQVAGIAFKSERVTALVCKRQRRRLGSVPKHLAGACLRRPAQGFVWLPCRISPLIRLQVAFLALLARRGAFASRSVSGLSLMAPRPISDFRFRIGD